MKLLTLLIALPQKAWFGLLERLLYWREGREKRQIANDRERIALERDEQALIADKLQNVERFLALEPKLPPAVARSLKPTLAKRRLPPAS